MPEININKKRNTKEDAIVHLEDAWNCDEFRLREEYLESAEVEDFFPGESSLLVPIGKDEKGEIHFNDLNRDFGLFGAGEMYSGVGMLRRVALLSLIKKNPKELLDIVIIDPIRVMDDFANIPHLVFPIAREREDIMEAMKWCSGEMNRRFHELTKHNSRGIFSHTRKGYMMKYLVVVITEYDELSNDSEFNKLFRRFAYQKVIGIRFIVTTQRPTEAIRENCITINRVASKAIFKLPSKEMSDTLLYSLLYSKKNNNAEELLGQGDMFYEQHLGDYNAKRLQGVYVEEVRVKKLISEIIEEQDKFSKLLGKEFYKTKKDYFGKS